MAIDITLADIAAGFNLSKLNANFDAIETALQDGLSRSGSSPNQMLSDFDLNSNDILNGGRANFTSIFINGEPVFDLAQAAVEAAEAAAVEAEASAAEAALSAGAAATAEAGAEAAQAAAEDARDEAVEAAGGVDPLVTIDETDIAGAGPGGYILENKKIYQINPHGTDVTVKLPAGATQSQEFTVLMMDTTANDTVITIDGNGNDIAQDGGTFDLNINYTGDKFKLDLTGTNYVTTFINVLGVL